MRQGDPSRLQPDLVHLCFGQHAIVASHSELVNTITAILNPKPSTLNPKPDISPVKGPYHLGPWTADATVQDLEDAAGEACA